MTLTSYLGKKYKLDSSKNYDDYLDELGVNMMMRQLSNTIYPVVELTKEGDEYILTSKSILKNITIKFTPGVEFTQESLDGREVKTVIEIDGNILHEVQVGINNKKAVIDRKFSDDQIEEVMTVNNVTATRIYKLQ